MKREELGDGKGQHPGMPPKSSGVGGVTRKPLSHFLAFGEMCKSAGRAARGRTRVSAERVSWGRNRRLRA